MVRSRTLFRLGLGGMLTTVTVAAMTSPATAAPAPPPLHVVSTLSTKDFIAPLQFAVKDHKIVVADSFAGTLSRLGQSGPPTVIPGIEGIAFGPHGSYAYTTANEDHSATFLVIVDHHRTRKVNLATFEKIHNPDQGNHYGTTSTDPCVINALTPPPGQTGPEGPPPPAKYTGAIDSNPYAVLAWHGSWLVADAGGNDILKVNKHGDISVHNVLPPQPVVVTRELAVANFGPNVPACVTGTTYNFEPVPTDIEANGRGGLYGTTLGSVVPGNGSVYRYDKGRHPVKVVGGLTTPTNLAIDKAGDIFVAQLFTGQIAEIPRHHRTFGRATTVATLPFVAALEWAHGKLYAATSPAAASEGAATPPGPPPFGKIVVLKS